MSAQKVYLLTDGDYSSYRVIGVYSTHENAEKMRGYLHGDIEEFDLDTGIDKICAGRHLTDITIKRDGSVRNISYHTNGIDIAARLNLTGWPDGGELQLTCWAKDFAHAVHIAGEARRQILAANLWPATREAFDIHPLRDELSKHLGAALDRAVAVVDEKPDA